MYTEYFGLSEMPFNITPDPKFLYLSPTHREAMAHLRYGIKEKKGFIVITGEVGCGKTTLCRALLNELDPKTHETALILNPRVHETQLLRDILKELGHKISPKTEQDLVGTIHETLLDKVNEGKNIVLIIDEAQNLSFEVLEQIRLLSNLETDTQKLLQIILIGQPELNVKLNHNRLRQLKQRILVHYNLTPLSYKEVHNYIEHRITLSKSSGKPTFSYWAMRKIYNHSKGIPRIINNICDKSLLSAYVNATEIVSYFDVRRAIREIKFSK